MTLGFALSLGRTANLDLLRLLLAASVIVSHAWPLARGGHATEPFEAMTGHSLGGWAVALFFFLSGLLVTASAERRSPGAFWRARARRIFPGLIVALLTTCALALASGATADPVTASKWFVRALTLVSIEHHLPGAFAANPMPGVVNGPLWSLFHEIAAYALCWLFVASLGVRKPGPVLILVIASAIAAIAMPETAGRAATFAPLFSAFALGMGAYAFRKSIRLRPAFALLFVPLVFSAPWPVAVAALAYAMVAIALSAPTIRCTGDYSFGFYIYGWPVAQSILQVFPGMSPFELALASLAATAPFAVASWHLVERPALARQRVVV